MTGSRLEVVQERNTSRELSRIESSLMSFQVLGFTETIVAVDTMVIGKEVTCWVKPSECLAHHPLIRRTVVDKRLVWCLKRKESDSTRG